MTFYLFNSFHSQLELIMLDFTLSHLNSMKYMKLKLTHLQDD